MIPSNCVEELLLELELWKVSVQIQEIEEGRKDSSSRYAFLESVPLDVDKKTKEVKIDWAVINLISPLNN